MLNIVRMKLIERVEDSKTIDQDNSTSKIISSLMSSVKSVEEEQADPAQRADEIKKRFQGLKDVQKRFNDKVFGIISKAYYHAKNEPKLLVCALRIMMNEERVYK